ncbi:MAG TPA: DUF2797 domain-containing protein [Chitinophagales bacterium]
MNLFGTLHKMPTLYINPVQYFLKLGNEKLQVNELLNKSISLRFTGNIYCEVCGKKTKKSFGEGLCYNCFITSAEAGEWIMKPELSKAHLGIADRDLEYEKSVQLQPHFVYLALVNETKVGVTRETQIPTRWIDQGANSAIILAETPYRQLAGLIEVELKKYLSDKTNWQKMLKNEFNHSVNLIEEKARIKPLLSEDLQQYISSENEVVSIEYPVLEYPAKVTSLSFDKTPTIENKLVGIRGQYFIFEGGQVLNIRRHSGYEIELSA